MRWGSWLCLALAMLSSCTTPAAGPSPQAPHSVSPATPNAEPIAAPSEADPSPTRPPRAQAKPEQPNPNPYVAAPVRTGGDLTVHAPPREPSDDFQGRLRTHVEGTLSKGAPRVWVGPQVPGFVPLTDGTAELFLLDRIGDEFMALYREPYGAGDCGTGTVANCSYFVRLYNIEGASQWRVALHDLFSRGDQLELQDVRYADGTLYFNEACQSYSSGANGKCSSLVAYDPSTAEVRWRTRSLVSNGEFLVHGDYIVAGYGFTGERDHLFIVRRTDGKIMHKVRVRTAATTFAVPQNGLLEVRLYSGEGLTFELRGWEGDTPKLVRIQRAPRRGRSTVGRR